MKRAVCFVCAIGTCTLGLAAVPLLAGAQPHQTSQASEKNTASATSGTVIEKALDEVQLRPDQKAEIETLKAKAEKRHTWARAAKGEFLRLLADQIEKGNIGRCALEQPLKVMVSAVADAHPGDRAAFEQLHRILDSEQRSVFVEALKRHWELHQKTHAPVALAEKTAKELNLDADQRASMEKILTGIHEVREAEPGHAGHRERWTKILDAFEGDRFVLDEVAPMGDVASHTKAKVEWRLWAGEAVLPVLNPGQRKEVADKLRERVKEAGQASQGVSPSIDPTEDE